MVKMKGIITHLTDVLGNKYLGIKQNLSTGGGLIAWQKWENHYFKDDRELECMKLIDNQQKRDNYQYHTTILSVPEYNKAKQEALKFLGTEVEFFVLGIGKAIDSKKGNEAHFIVLDSYDLQNIRTKLGFDKKDFHITIGFDKKDVFTQPKDTTSIYIDID